MGIKGVMTLEELIAFMNERKLPGDVQAIIISDYAHLYGYVEGLEMGKRDA